MKYKIFLLFFIFFLFSCGGKGNNVQADIKKIPDNLKGLTSGMVRNSDGDVIKFDCLKFSSDGDFSIYLPNDCYNGVLYYSTDTDSWNVWDGYEALLGGGNIYLCGKNNTTFAQGKANKVVRLNLTENEVFHGITPQSASLWGVEYTKYDSPVNVSGNIDTLLNYSDVIISHAPYMDEYCFKYFFAQNEDLHGVPYILPAKNLSKYCYSSMFENCINIEIPPILPSKKLKEGCYENMFKGCSKLSCVPGLPNSMIFSTSYTDMFANCSSLKFSPVRTEYYNNPVNIGYCNEAERISFLGGTSGVLTTNVPTDSTIWTSNSVVYSSPLESISFLLESFETNQGDICDIEIEAFPYGANSDCIWISSDNNIVEVDKYGRLLAIGTGECTINITSVEDENITAQLPITVNESEKDIDALMFESDMPFSVYIAKKTWNGHLMYSSKYPSLTWGKIESFPFTMTPNVSADGKYKLYIRGYSNTTMNFNSTNINNCNSWQFTSESEDTEIICKGDILNLLNYEDTKTVSMDNYCFAKLFCNNTLLVSPPKLSSRVLSEHCYDSMFEGCTKLQDAPSLSAQSMKTGCYSSMFKGCTSLKTLPELRSSNLAVDCYRSMFESCSFTYYPYQLPASTMKKNCYYEMFKSSGLTKAPTMYAKNLDESCMQSMFEGSKQLTSTQVDFNFSVTAKNCCKNMFKDCVRLVVSVPISIPEGLEMSEGCFFGMFENTSISQFDLPFMNLAKQCYYRMFAKCTRLSNPPALPATVAKEECYAYMFEGSGVLSTANINIQTPAYGYCCGMYKNCDNIASIGNIFAPTLAEMSHAYMFEGCKNLNLSVSLPLMDLHPYCYKGMFKDCITLTVPMTLPAVKLAAGCYEEMFSGCVKFENLTVYFTSWEATSEHLPTVIDGSSYPTKNLLNSVMVSRGTLRAPSALSGSIGQFREKTSMPTSWTLTRI